MHKEGKLKALLRILDVMDQRGMNQQLMGQQGVRAYFDTYVFLLQGCANRKALIEGKQVHAHMIKRGLEPNLFLGNALVSMYTRCGSVVDARQVFDNMPKRDAMSWATIISGYAQHGNDKEALKLFQEMSYDCLNPNEGTFVSVLKACASLAAVEQGKQIHGQIVQSGFEGSIVLWNTLINMYVKCGNMVDAQQVFNEMPEQNVFSWTVMIAGYADLGYVEDALKLFIKMLQGSVKPNEATFVSVLKACASVAALEQGKKIHAHILKTRFETDIFVGSALIDMYAKCRSIENARQVFNKMPTRNVVSWTAMIAGYAQQGLAEDSLKLFWQMEQESVTPDRVAFLSVLKACSTPATLKEGKKIHAQIINSGFESSDYMGNTLVDMYAKCGSIEYARQVFDRMHKRTVVSWNVMILGYAQHLRPQEALEIFWQMQQRGVNPDTVTFVAILSACANLAALEQAKQIHAQIIRSGLESDTFVGSTLVDTYAKCGNIDCAQHVFDKMPKQDLVLWNAMISGYSQHGRGEEALKLFQEMQLEEVRLDYITFIGVLSACSHAGLVDEGCHHFRSMKTDHGIMPAAKHYACMVDLFGRAGRLNEAGRFIMKMPCQPTAVVWMALLGACRSHNNVEVAQWVAEFILQLEPQNASAFVLLSNIYAVANRWDDRAEVRKTMVDRGVKKEAGNSCIEVNNQVHTFVAEDASHPQIKEIHEELKRLFVLMSEVGYVPDTCFELHDVEMEKKGSSLCHHSEKLAIAFGLITIPVGMSIRIIKNLRVCGDCHTTIKFISKLVGREIILRDANRFHHFKNGVCSCGDFW